MRLSAMTPRPTQRCMPAFPFIEAAAESVASLEHADAPFAADAPSLRFAEPALLLALATLRTLGAPDVLSQILPGRAAFTDVSAPVGSPAFGKWYARADRRCANSGYGAFRAARNPSTD